MKTLTLIATALTATLAAPADASQTRSVTFDVGGDKVVGTLYLPDDYREGAKLPAVVVTGAWTTVKEQMPAVYAEALADRGYAALTFDFRGWGASAGQPRQLENPTRKTADIVAAAAFLATRPEIDSQQISGLGICASAGYMAGATVQSPHLRSVALVAPWLHDRAIVNTVYGGSEGVARLIATGREAEAQARRTGEAVMIPAASTTDRSALMFEAPYYTETNRGMIPAWVNQFNVASWEGWLTFDAQAIAPRLTKPLTIVHSEAAAIPQGARQFYGATRGSKRQLWLPDVTQFDFYDRPAPVTAAVDFVVAGLKPAR